MTNNLKKPAATTNKVLETEQRTKSLNAARPLLKDVTGFNQAKPKIEFTVYDNFNRTRLGSVFCETVEKAMEAAKLRYCSHPVLEDRAAVAEMKATRAMSWSNPYGEIA